MEFINHTPFPAIAFQGIDQHDQQFHVVVLRQTLTWDANGLLDYADEQAPLCEEDTYFGAINASAVRQESDLCQYKPRCDVIVNATAHAPAGKAACRFDVRLVLRRPDSPAPLPAAPHPLHPFMPISLAQKKDWQAQVDLAKRSPVPGKILIDKTLCVTGERQFVRRFWPLCLVAGLVKWTTLGLVRFTTWHLTAPKPASAVPVRDDLAFGGQCRLNVSDKSARRVARRHRLKLAEQAAHPDADGPAEQRALAHAAFASNPVGRGYTRDWFIKATQSKRIAAPQIEHPRHQLTSRDFAKALAGKLDKRAAKELFVGLGVRPKGHPERAKLVGTIDEAFIKSTAWLPQDFDFGVWNAAWPDQQTEHLQGDEIIELTNLCAPDTLAARLDEKRNIQLRLQLPGDECELLIRLESGEIFQHSMRLDTLLIEPALQQCHLVWRTPLNLEDETPIRVVEAWLVGAKERETARQEIEHIKAAMEDSLTKHREGLPNG